MDKVSKYIIDHFDEYGCFENLDQCKCFLAACEVYGTSLEMAKENPDGCMHDFGFCMASGCDVSEVVKAITDHSELHEDMTLSQAKSYIYNRYFEGMEDEETGSTEDDFFSGDCDIRETAFGVFYRIYC